MSSRSLLSALTLCASLLAGCVVETPTNAPAPAATRVENRAEPTPGPTPAGVAGAEGRPSPESGAFVDAPAGAGMDAPAGAGGKLGLYERAAAAGLAPEQREALGRIADEGRRLLALRGYLRAGSGAAARWAWSREQIEAYEKSPEHAAALAEVEKVRRAFEASNPGHTLRVNTNVRSLDEQLEKWSQTDSVGRAGAELLGRAREEVAGASYGDGAAAADVRRFEGFLRGYAPRATPTVAVPGLSPHGQSRAFDFQVMRGAQLVAGPSSPDAWDVNGWTVRLQEAVGRASAKFSGPLASPREPWHYEYRP
ncbi:MAG TPA: hypothetical protein VF668_21515 [Pyrinomonadaceae bacterium]|jgi:hypothetical protein